MTKHDASQERRAPAALAWTLTILVGSVTATALPITAFSHFGNSGSIPALMDAAILFMTVAGCLIVVGGVIAWFRSRKASTAWICLAMMAAVAVTAVVLMWVATGGAGRS